MTMSVSITRNPNLAKSRQQNVYAHHLKTQFGETWWTGLPPMECAGFDHERQCLTGLPLLNLKNCNRQDVLNYFNNSWTLTELLFQGVKIEEAYTRSPYHGLRHPLIFYYGHPSVVYVNKMRLAGFFENPIDLYLEKILETGVDEMSWDDMNKNDMEWPSVKTVHAYRKTIYKMIVDLISTHPDLDSMSNVLENSPWWALWMGMEHEKIHFETSSVLIRELPIELVETPRCFAPLHPSRQDNTILENGWIKKEGREVKIGKAKWSPSYGWDNEYGERIQVVKDFQYTKYQVTNRDYFEFVKSGSYLQDFFWTEEGLQWRKFRNTKRPTFWVGVGPEGSHQYELRTIFDIIPMPWNWPVEVNFHEASAYCRWKNEKDKGPVYYRLLTEGEFTSLKNDRQLSAPNYNFNWSTPQNVTETLCGNTWHWLLDQFNPLPQFVVHPYYDDFSTPCFDGKHQMILGGSFMSCGDEAGPFARFHFRPHFYQHSGFRMAATLDGSGDNGAIKLLQTNEYVHPYRQNALQQMETSPNWWHKIEQPLEMKGEEVTSLMHQTQVELLDYLRKFENMKAMGLAHDPETNGLKKDFTCPYQMTKNFPESAENYSALLKMIFQEMAPLSQLPGHPAFAAYVAGSGNIISSSAELIAHTLNPFTGHYMMAPGLVLLEQEVIKWFINLMGYDDKQAVGYLTTGGSSATMNALIIARLNKLEGVDYTRVTAYMSSEAHHSIAKAWVMLGFKKENLRLVPVSKIKKFKMDANLLQQMIEEDKKKGFQPFFLVATAGTTKTGSIDEIGVLTEIATKENLWLHADGAYGAFFMLTQKGKDLLGGIEKCDSITLDPHKSLSIPYGTGCLLVKDGSKIHFDYVAHNSYMPPHPLEGEYDYADITAELSRNYRGLGVWLPIKTLGIAPFILNLEEKLKLSTWVSEKLRGNPDFEVIADPELTILAFAHKKGDEATKQLMIKINTAGTIFLSSCILDDKFAIRICLLGYRVHYERLAKALKEIEQMAKEC